VAADATGVSVMIGEKPLEQLQCDFTPGIVHQVSDAIEAGAGIGCVAVFVRREFVAYVVIRMQAAIGVIIIEYGDALRADLDVGDSSITIAKHHVAC